MSAFELRNSVLQESWEAGKASHTVNSGQTGQPKNSGLILRMDKRYIASPKCPVRE